MQSQPPSHSHYAAVPLPQHPHPPPPPHHPPSYQHHLPHPHEQPYARYEDGPSQHQHQQQSHPHLPSAPNGMMRFGIPLSPGPMAAGGRHKKDIKRRTKTGCLTCRKRRIKCDEGHPTCRNCEKSKRECLGYDPIFKQQSGHAPIQPAPAHSTPGVPDKQATFLPGSVTSPFSPSQFSHFPPMSPRPVQAPPSLDPALSGAGLHSPLGMAANGSNATLQPARIAKPVAIDELFSLNDIPPNYEVRDVSLAGLHAQQQDIDDFYRFHFAQGLDRLFETKWYSTRGLDCLRQDAPLLDFVAQCTQQFRNPDPAATGAVQSLEARLVWQLAIMPRSSPNQHSTGMPSLDQLTDDVASRVDAVEHLLTGRYLAPERVPPPPSGDQHNHTEYNERQFWHQLATFTSVRDDTAEAHVKPAIDAALNQMRAILGMMENRDVLYSLAIARHLGGRLPEFRPHRPLPMSEDADGEIRSLEVARGFVVNEDQKGTTQVIQRICGMAMRSWSLQKR